MSWSCMDTEYSIHRVQHTLSTAYTQDWLPSLQSHDYELTTECSFSFWRASLQDQPPSASSQSELKRNVTFSHSHGCVLTNWWKEYQHLARRPSTVSKYMSKLARLQPPSLHNHGLQVRLHSRSIRASEFISKFTWTRPSNLLDYSLQVRMIMACQVHLQTRSITASKFPRSWPPNASPNLLNQGLQVNIWVHSIVIFRRPSNCSQALPAASPDIPCVDR